MGVAVVIVPAPQGCPAGGVSRWLSPVKALLMAGNRTRTHDVLWFTFFHEICHLLQHSRKMTVGEGVRGLDAGLEEEGNAFEVHLTIPQADARRSGELLSNAEVMASIARGIGGGQVRGVEGQGCERG